MVSAEGLSAYLSVVKSSAKCLLSRERLDRLPAFLGILLDRLRVAPCLAGKKEMYFFVDEIYFFISLDNTIVIVILNILFTLQKLRKKNQ